MTLELLLGHYRIQKYSQGQESEIRAPRLTS